MIFILDKSMNIRDSLSNSGEISHITPFFDDIYTSYLETGAETYQFSTLANTKESQHLIVGNHIAFQYEDEYKLFTITEIEETHDENFIKTVYCEMAGLKLINKIIRPIEFKSTNLRKFLEEILSDTDWNIGLIDIGLNNVCDIEVKDYTNAYSLLQTHIRESYKGEIHFTVKFEGSKATKYINVYSNRGQFDGFRFSYDSNLTSITRTINFDDLATALIGVGNNGLTFKEIETEDKPLNQDFITDETAYLLWNDNGSHILGYEKFDTDSPQELLKLTREKLKERCQPKIKYELNPELLGETVKIGDTVYVVDNEFNPPIHLSARINQLSISLTDKSNNSCVLSNFTEITSNITEEMRQIASQLEGYVDGQFPIGGDKIQDGAINGDKLTNGQIIQGTHIFANSITADHIQAETIDTEHLKADSIDAEKIQANSITSNHIQSNTIETEHLKANIIQSEHIQSNTIDANHIISNSINSGHIQTGSITAGSGIIADGAIGNAQISSIDAGKIEAGTIDTSKVTVQGSNGHLRIKGNRLQVFNGTGNQAKERVSVGDVNGDGTVYGLRVRGADGQTVLLDENGVTSEGITDGSITNEKISDDANIDGAKLNINSVVSKINEDGTETIQGTKIEVDGTTLNTKLSTITNKQTEDGERITQAQSQITANTNAIKLKVDEQTYTTDKKDMTSKLEKNTSEISTMKGQIALKVEQTDIENAKSEMEGVIDTKVDSAKAEIKVTTDAISQNVSNLSQTVSTKADGSTVSSLNSKVSSLETSVNGISGKVTSLEKTTTTLGTQVDTANTNASSALNKANSATTTANNAQNTANTNKSNITDLQGEVSTVKSNVASLEVTTSGISQKVSSVESTTATLSGKVDTANNNATNALNTANNANSKVDNLQIGATNLLKNTKDLKNWGQSGSNISIAEESYKGLTVQKQFGDWAYKYMSTNLSILEVGKEYTASVYLKCTGTSPTVYFTPSNNNGLNGNGTDAILVKITDRVTTDWKRYSVTFTVTNNYKLDGNINMRVESSGYTNGSALYVAGIKLEKGNKATDWTPAPEDVDSSINSVDSKVESTKSKVATIETNLSGITSRVSNVETNQTTVNGKVSSLETRMSTAESKITEDAITNTVKKNFYTKSETDSQITSKGYQTASQVQQTVDGLEVKVSQSGGYNLLRNTGFRTGDLKGGWWIQQHNNPVGSYGFLTHTADWGFPDSTVKTVQLRMANQTGVEYGLAQKFDTAIGKKYTVSFYYASHRCSKANIIIRNSSGAWIGSKSFNPSAYSGGKTSVTNWGKISYTFTATESNHTLNIVLNDAQNDGYMWIAKPVIEEGSLATEYSPHPSEIYDGITTIDKDGITVNQSNAKSKTTMSANGFAITRTDNNKDIFRVGSDGLLTLNGVFKCYKNGVNQTGDRLESSGAIMFGYNERGGNNPVFASGLWTNESMGYFSVGYTRADISDTNGCLWISPTSGNDGCRLTYSKAVGSEVKTTNLYFKKNGTIEFATNMAGMNDTDNSYTYLFDSGVSTKSLKCYNLRPRNIIPLANGTYNLGRAGARFKDTYTDTVSTTNHSLILGTVTDSGAWQTYGGMAINSATGYVFPHLGNGNLSLGSYSNRFHTLFSINAVNVSSDKRLKTDIHYLDEPMGEVQVINGDIPRVSKNMNITTQDMYDFVKNDLKLASYRYKANIERGDTSVDYNFIAQDILYTKVGSEIVQLEDKEDLDSLLSYNQGNYISVVVGALQKEIELRDKQIANLEERLSKLESKLK